MFSNFFIISYKNIIDDRKIYAYQIIYQDINNIEITINQINENIFHYYSNKNYLFHFTIRHIDMKIGFLLVRNLQIPNVSLHNLKSMCRTNPSSTLLYFDT